MNISNQGLSLIKEFESFSSTPYPDVIGVNTIGYGTTVYPNGNRVLLSDPKCNEAQAEIWLQNDLKRFINDLNRLVKVEVAQYQFDALCSLIYNIGTTHFGNSTLLKKLNNKDFLGAAEEFPKWNKAGGKVVQGLVNRRAKERKLFLND